VTIRFGTLALRRAKSRSPLANCSPRMPGGAEPSPEVIERILDERYRPLRDRSLNSTGTYILPTQALSRKKIGRFIQIKRPGSRVFEECPEAHTLHKHGFSHSLYSRHVLRFRVIELRCHRGMSRCILKQAKSASRAERPFSLECDTSLCVR
jgi:hypothetical protein